jgi:hypothetical protein
MNTAAAILASLLGIGPMAERGRPPPGKPVIVGERGPGVFVPDQSGMVVPFGVPPIDDGWARADEMLRPAEEYLEHQRAGPYGYILGGNKLNPKPFSDWLESLPESAKTSRTGATQTIGRPIAAALSGNRLANGRSTKSQSPSHSPKSSKNPNKESLKLVRISRSLSA